MPIWDAQQDSVSKTNFFFQLSQALVTHAYDSNYLEGEKQNNHSLKPIQAKSYKSPSQPVARQGGVYLSSQATWKAEGGWYQKDVVSRPAQAKKLGRPNIKGKNLGCGNMRLSSPRWREA
jgi:hypothetical protein